jgi:hypothetical protein
MAVMAGVEKKKQMNKQRIAANVQAGFTVKMNQ